MWRSYAALIMAHVRNHQWYNANIIGTSPYCQASQSNVITRLPSSCVTRSSDSAVLVVGFFGLKGA